MSSQPGEFFDRHAEHYHSKPAGMGEHHEVTARKIEAGLAGSVLSIGGLWNRADLSRRSYRLTILDMSAEMLKRYAAEGVELIQGDARTVPLEPGSFDHVVLPLVLHHIAGTSAVTARAHVREVLGKVARALRPGGRVWISEFCVPAAVYGAEALAAPLVRRGLALAGIPLVVMHSAGFYRDALTGAGFTSVEVEAIQPTTKAPTWITPVIGLPWLRFPRALYPARPTLITARR